MKKIVIHKAGSYEQLRIEEMRDPKPGPDEVPIAPGFEASGVVELRDEAVREASSCFSRTCPAFLRSGGLSACCLHDGKVTT